MIIDVCGYCKEAEENSKRVIRHYLKYAHKQARVIIVGCLAQINPEALREFSRAAVIPHRELSKLDCIIKARTKFATIPKGVEVKKFPPLVGRDDYSPVRQAENIFRVLELKRNGLNKTISDSPDKEFHVRVAQGCLGRCAYCAIKDVWGGLESRPLIKIKKEFRRCLDRGADVVIIEAQDLGAYGQDIGTNIVALLEELFSCRGTYRLVLNDFNPQWLIRYFVKLKAIFRNTCDRVVYLNVPILSGSNRMLKLMNREYQIEDAERAIFELKESSPELFILSDIMLGFPGETDRDFEMSKRFIKKLKSFKNTEPWITVYSDRPNTLASKMKMKVDSQEIKNRIAQLKKI